MVALRERQGRTLPFVTMTEAEGVTLANDNVDRMATMSADEASHWDMLHAGWHVDRVNHSETYSDHGKHTNMVESYFSRLRRMVQGQHRHVSQMLTEIGRLLGGWFKALEGVSQKQLIPGLPQ